MAQTVQAAFNQFFDEINLSGDHRTIANARRDHLIELLGNKFHVIEAFPSRSIPKYTALHEQADLDIMLVLHYGKHVEGKTPGQVLKAVRDSISYKTTVRRNGQAVTLCLVGGKRGIPPRFAHARRTSPVKGRPHLQSLSMASMAKARFAFFASPR